MHISRQRSERGAGLDLSPARPGSARAAMQKLLDPNRADAGRALAVVVPSIGAQNSAARKSQAAKPRSRVQIVAHAVATDDHCKGKAALALSMLADDELAGVTGAGIVKMLARIDAARVPMPHSGGGNDLHGWGAIHAEIHERRVNALHPA